MRPKRRRLGRDTARLAHELDVALDRVELTLTEYRILGELELDVAGNGQLARALGVTPPTVTAVVDGLARRGLVDRGRIERDRRRVVLELTPVGRCLLRRADEVAEQHLSDLDRAVTQANGELDQRQVAAGMRASGRARQAP